MTIIQSIETARFINITTFQWPFTFAQIQKLYPNIGWGSSVTFEELTVLGYSVIEPRQAPSGQVVTEIDPEYIDGQFYQRWSVRDYTPEEISEILEEKKQEATDKVARLKDQTLQKGYPYHFESQLLHVQMRDSDRTNIIGMNQLAERNPGMIQMFRTYENVNVLLTPEQLFAMSNAVGDAYTQLMSVTWQLKDEISDATSEDQLPALPETIDGFYADHLHWTPVTS